MGDLEKFVYLWTAEGYSLEQTEVGYFRSKLSMVSPKKQTFSAYGWSVSDLSLKSSDILIERLNSYTF